MTGLKYESILCREHGLHNPAEPVLAGCYCNMIE